MNVETDPSAPDRFHPPHKNDQFFIAHTEAVVLRAQRAVTAVGTPHSSFFSARPSLTSCTYCHCITNSVSLFTSAHMWHQDDWSPRYTYIETGVCYMVIHWRNRITIAEVETVSFPNCCNEACFSPQGRLIRHHTGIICLFNAPLLSPSTFLTDLIDSMQD